MTWSSVAMRLTMPAATASLASTMRPLPEGFAAHGIDADAAAFGDGAHEGAVVRIDGALHVAGGIRVNRAVGVAFNLVFAGVDVRCLDPVALVLGTLVAMDHQDADAADRAAGVMAISSACEAISRHRWQPGVCHSDDGFAAAQQRMVSPTSCTPKHLPPGLSTSSTMALMSGLARRCESGR